MDLELQNRSAVVTGASRGIGRAICATLAGEGADVLALARGEADLARLATDLGVRTAACDVVEASDLDRIAGDIAESGRPIDILVCNVGSGRSTPPGEERVAEWRRVLDVNLLSTVGVIERFQSHLSTDAVVICTSSIAGLATVIS